MPERSRWRRHRPGRAAAGRDREPRRRDGATAGASSPCRAADTSIMLTLDVSRSMCSTDVTPNRLAAAAGRGAQVRRRPAGGTAHRHRRVRGIAQILVPPTTDTRPAAATRSTASRPSIGTAIGNGILDVDRRAVAGEPRHRAEHGEAHARPTRKRHRFASKYVPDIVVLLTDGASDRRRRPASTRPSRPPTAACACTRSASAPTNPATLVCTSEQLGADTFGAAVRRRRRVPPGSFGGGRSAAQLPRDRRRDARSPSPGRTGGTYARREAPSSSTRVFHDLPQRIATQKEDHELTVYFVGARRAARDRRRVGLSLWWNRYRLTHVRAFTFTGGDGTRGGGSSDPPGATPTRP